MIMVFDLGATKTRLALSADGRTFLGTPHVMDTDTTAGGQAHLIAEARRLAGKHTIELVVGGAPGTVDRAKGRLLAAPNLPKWGTVDLGGLFKATFKAPLYLENDTALVGLGEVVAGVPGGRKGIVAYVTISTGVNGVRIVDGHIDRSTFGFELGRQIVAKNGSKVVTLEDVIGGHSLQMKYGRLPKSIDDPAVWREETRHLAVAVYNLMIHWSPQTIIMGGSMMRDIPLGPLAKELRALPPVFPEWPELRSSALEDKGGLYGALEYARMIKEA